MMRANILAAAILSISWLSRASALAALLASSGVAQRGHGFAAVTHASLIFSRSDDDGKEAQISATSTPSTSREPVRHDNIIGLAEGEFECDSDGWTSAIGPFDVVEHRAYLLRVSADALFVRIIARAPVRLSRFSYWGMIQDYHIGSYDSQKVFLRRPRHEPVKYYALLDQPYARGKWTFSMIDETSEKGREVAEFIRATSLKR